MKKFQHSSQRQHANTLKSLFISLAFLPSFSFAQDVQELVKTTNDCSVYISSAIVKAKSVNPNKTEISWRGECINGLAEGVGDLQTTDRYGQGANVIANRFTQRTKMRAGNIFGFSKDSFNSGSTVIVSWSFKYNDRTISFNGLGLQGDDAILANNDNNLPQRLNDVSQINKRIWDSGIGDMSFTSASCAYHKSQFPECEFGGEPAQNYQVHFYVYRAANASPRVPGAKMFEGSALTFCPQPRNLGSCAQIAAQVTEPIVRGAENFIKESMPGVRAMEGEMRKVLAARDQEKATVSAAAAREQASANAAFEAKISKAGVGELFAMADEFKSKGDLNRARAALRQLMGRFPDHKLATQAAAILTELQGQ